MYYMLKKCISIAFPAIAAIMSLSCNKQTEPVNPPVIEINVFTAGNEYGSSSQPTPVIYKDSEELYRLEKGSTVSGVAYIGNDLYACGTSGDGHPVMWKNGSQDNGALAAMEGTLNDMVSDGANWFCCGSVTVGGEEYGIITKNGAEVFRCKQPSSFRTIDLGASGDWYVVGTVDNKVCMLRVGASKSDVMSSFVISDDLKYVPTDIYVGLHDICVSLTKRTVDDDTAYCWISTTGELIRLYDGSSAAECVAIYNGSVITGGCIRREGASIAVQWTNGYAEDFSYGCSPVYSNVKLLRNGGYNLYEAVQSAGQVQICCNGALIGTIKCDDSFEAEAWDIVRVK